MAKSKEELNKIKEEVETVNEKLQELTEEELLFRRLNECSTATLGGAA